MHLGGQGIANCLRFGDKTFAAPENVFCARLGQIARSIAIICRFQSRQLAFVSLDMVGQIGDRGDLAAAVTFGDLTHYDEILFCAIQGGPGAPHVFGRTADRETLTV